MKSIINVISLSFAIFQKNGISIPAPILDLLVKVGIRHLKLLNYIG